MPPLRDMRLRIRSVRNIAQVTRALQTVSASKVRRAQEAIADTQPYAEKAREVLSHLAGKGEMIRHPMLVQRKRLGAVLVVVVSGDRGLAGAYNAGVVRATLENFLESAAPTHYIVFGRKGRDMLFRAGATITAEFSDLPSPPAYGDISPIGRLAIEEYIYGKADQVHIVYTQFQSMMQQRPAVVQLLPVQDLIPPPISAGRFQTSATGYLFEPGQKRLLDYVINRLVSMEIYEAVLESLASEHAARMVMMRKATDNAAELIDGMRLLYNKARQQNITADLLDITAGTEALAARGADRGFLKGNMKEING
jgi:F-type H+-transporting ATPase subunit gamma